MRQRLWQMVILGIKQFRDPYYQGFAAQISFYLLLSIVPILLLLTQLLGVFDLTVENAVGWISQYTGMEISGLLKSLTKFSMAGFSNVVFMVVALWASSRAQFSIMRIANYTFSEGQTTGRGYWRERFRAVRTMTVTIFAIAFSLIVLGFGDLILEGIFKIIEINPDTYLETVWNYSRWIIGFALYFFMIGYNYYILPTSKVPFQKLLPGTIFASVGMLLVTLIYAQYTTSVARYDIIYGTLSSIVAVLFWFYFLAWVLCLGILFNKVWSDTEEYSKRKPVER